MSWLCKVISRFEKEDENNGVLYTGDIGYLEDGLLYIEGRKSWSQNQWKTNPFRTFGRKLKSIFAVIWCVLLMIPNCIC